MRRTKEDLKKVIRRMDARETAILLSIIEHGGLELMKPILDRALSSTSLAYATELRSRVLVDDIIERRMEGIES